jgi:hypothetical protein
MLTLINPSPFYLDNYNMTGTLFIIVYRYILFKILYFDITWTLTYAIISYSIVWDVQYDVYIEISGIWKCQEAWSSDIYKRSLFSSGTGLQMHVQKVSVKDHPMGHYDLTAWVKLP